MSGLPNGYVYIVNVLEYNDPKYPTRKLTALRQEAFLSKVAADAFAWERKVDMVWGALIARSDLTCPHNPIIDQVNELKRTFHGAPTPENDEKIRAIVTSSPQHCIEQLLSMISKSPEGFQMVSIWVSTVELHPQ